MSKDTAMRLVIAVLLGASLGIAGCAQNSSAPTRTVTEDTDLVQQSYTAADKLLARVPWMKEDHQPLLTASFANINALEDSSALGRMISEQMSSRFSQQGFTMIEVKMRNNIFIKQNGGEFVLSRSVKDLSQSHNAAAVVAGTYAVGRNKVYVNARLIRAADNLILASYDYTLPLGPNAKALLASN